MDKKQLSQLRYLNKEIELIKEQISNIESSIQPEVTTDSVKGSYPFFPYIQHTVKISGIDWSRYENKVKRLKRRLKRRLKELMEQVEELNEYILTIEDSEMRQILTLRYIEGLSWQEIAEHMGHKGDGSTERKKHDKFLKIS